MATLDNAERKLYVDRYCEYRTRQIWHSEHEREFFIAFCVINGYHHFQV